MAVKAFKIVHLYPAEMNIYGDRGNIITLAKRLGWRGIEFEVIDVGIGQSYDFKQADIVFGGGGQDRGQMVIAEDLQKRRHELVAAAEEGTVILTICGTYQLFGHGFKTKDGNQIPGVDIFRANTVASNVRMIGNIVVSSDFGELVGFENHSGQTRLEASQAVLGKVIKGFGNNDHDKAEGAVYKNAFGTYLHGPLLPKNPLLADELIKRAMLRKFGRADLQPLDDGLENQAAQIAKTRPQ